MCCRRAIAIAALAHVFAVGADAGPLDAPIFQVNTYTTGEQEDPDIAFLPGGDFIVAWTSREGGVGDDRYWSIQAQRFARGGEPTGGELQLNSYTTDLQAGPAIAAQPSGEFLVAWSSDGSFGDDDSSTSVQVRRFSAGVEPVGAEIQVNSHTLGGQGQVDIASVPGQGFVVAWRGWTSPGSDDSGESVQVRRLALDGSPLGSDFQVNVYTTGGQTRTAVAAAADGSYEVVWERYPAVAAEGSIFKRRFDSHGAPLGGEMLVSTDTSTEWFFADIAMRPSGEAVVVAVGQDQPSSGWRFDASGDPVGARFALGTDVTGPLTMPAVALDADGSFVVAWREPRENAEVAVEAQRFAADGTPVGEEVLVSGELLGQGPTPALAFGPAGELVVVWPSNDTGGSDGSGSSIQRTRPQIFFDGFESGDGCRWSESLALGGGPCT